MMYKDRSEYTKVQWDLKRKYDEAFDKVCEWLEEKGMITQKKSKMN